MALPASLRDGTVGLLALGLAGLVLARLPQAGATEPAPLAAATPAPTTRPAVSSAASPVEAPPEPLPSGPMPPSAGPITADDPPRIASYTLSARLDAEKHEITGKGTIYLDYRRPSSGGSAGDRPLYCAIVVHLYLNAFKNERSLFLSSPFGEGRGGARALDWGYIDVKRLAVRELGGVDVWPQHTPLRGEYGYPGSEDETAARIDLPCEVMRDQRLTLDVEWVSKLPRVVLRTGYEGDFHLAGQWFPKVAKGRGYQFHPQAEFFADFGDYDVTLDVPERAVVGATGERVESRTSGGRRLERYRASAVHDFAWTAWPGFHERRAAIDGVGVRLLYPPGHERNAQATLDTLAHALPHASRHYGRYPYPTLTVVHPPERASAAGGMEYPTFFTTGGPWFTGLFGDRALEALTVHELLHQWFYGILASDEQAAPFLDEGLTSYAELRALEARFGRGSALRGAGLELSATTITRLLSADRGRDAELSRAAAEFPGFRSLAALVYSRTAILLTTIGNVYGDSKLSRALTVYATRFRFRHPGRRDLIEVFAEEMGPEAAQVLELGLERGHVDYLVRDLENAREREPGGIFDGAQGRETRATAAPPEPAFRGRAVVYRHGNLELPIEIELVGTDGSRKRERWDGRGEFYVAEWRGRVPLAAVIADPDRRVLLDDDLLNNVVAARSTLPRRTLERASYWVGLLYAVVGP